MNKVLDERYDQVYAEYKKAIKLNAWVVFKKNGG